MDNLLDKLLFGTTNIKSKDHIEGKCLENYFIAKRFLEVLTIFLVAEKALVYFHY